MYVYNQLFDNLTLIPLSKNKTLIPFHIFFFKNKII